MHLCGDYNNSLLKPNEKTGFNGKQQVNKVVFSRLIWP